MSMNSSAFINRIAIFFYSILIAIMSAANRLRNYLESLIQAPPTLAQGSITTSNHADGELAQKSLPYTWATVSQVLVSLLIWTILGFAAGFLIGLINPR